jgi:hypothetical protein
MELAAAYITVRAVVMAFECTEEVTGVTERDARIYPPFEESELVPPRRHDLACVSGRNSGALVHTSDCRNSSMKCASSSWGSFAT